MAKELQLTKYAERKYNLTGPVDFKLAVDYSALLLAIAGADGELSKQEMQWYLDEQELLIAEPEEYLTAIREIDWKNVNIEEALKAINYNLPVNFRRAIVYQAIKMCRADNDYHQKEKAVVAKAGQAFHIKPDIVAIENSYFFKENLPIFEKFLKKF